MGPTGIQRKAHKNYGGRHLVTDCHRSGLQTIHDCTKQPLGAHGITFATSRHHCAKARHPSPSPFSQISSKRTTTAGPHMATLAVARSVSGLDSTADCLGAFLGPRLRLFTVFPCTTWAAGLPDAHSCWTLPFGQAKATREMRGNDQ